MRALISEPSGSASSFAPEDGPSQARRLVVLFPLLVFVGLAIALAWGMTRDPSRVPSALIGKPVPQFSLPPVKGRTLGLSSADLHGEVSLVNVFASWCLACRDEHPVLMQMMANNSVPIHGLNYKDQPDNAARWLNTMAKLRAEQEKIVRELEAENVQVQSIKPQRLT